MRVVGRSRSSKGQRKTEKNKEKNNPQKNNSPSLSHSVWGVEDGIGLYPTTASSSEHQSMFERDSNATAAPQAVPVKKTRPSALPIQNRFLPQHEPRKGQSPVEVIGSAALQFVPSFEESTSHPTGRVSKDPLSQTKTIFSSKKNKQRYRNDCDAIAWDAVIEADDSSLKSMESKGRGTKGKRPAWSVRKSLDKSFDSIPSASEKLNCRSNVLPGILLRRNHVSSKSSPPKVITRKQGEDEAISTISESTALAKQRGKRISRLASMFTSRSTAEDGSTQGPVRSGTTKLAASRDNFILNILPTSPSHSHISSSSSGYANWPGTQDKCGKTVAMESSYDDSSVGASDFHRRLYKQELEDNASPDYVNALKNHMRDPSGERVRERDYPLSRQIASGQEQYSDRERLKDGTADYHLAAIIADAYVHNGRNLSSPSTILRNSDKANNLNFTSNIKGDNWYNPSRTGRTASYNQTRGSSIAETSISGGLSIHNLFIKKTLEVENKRDTSVHVNDPWDVDTSDQPPSSPGTTVSKNSSAFFQMDENGVVTDSRDCYHHYGIRRNVQGAASIIRRKLTQEAPAVQNYLSPLHCRLNTQNAQGLRGYLTKTKDVPNLMDDEIDNDSIATSIATSTVTSDIIHHPISRTNRLSNFVIKSRGSVLPRQEIDEESDVFDGILSDKRFANNKVLSTLSSSSNNEIRRVTSIEGRNENLINVVGLGSGLSAIFTPKSDHEKQNGSNEFDDNLSNGDIDKCKVFKSHGSEQTNINYSPGVNKSRSPEGSSMLIRLSKPSREKKLGEFNPRMIHSSITNDDISDMNENDNIYQQNTLSDLSKYRVHPSLSKKLVHVYRSLAKSASLNAGGIQSKNEEDAKKSFALSEMRSRIMEKDLERGLERHGGTTFVDDIILTPYHQAACRVRDAVIVSKAWRDGSSPNDVMTAYNMTRRQERTYYVKRPVRVRAPTRFRDTFPRVSNFLGSGSSRAYTLEKVQWLDDTDFMQTRCPSMGPRNMRGFEMFTIGDCQSILLKLTNEQCNRLCEDLNVATSQQIDAEDMMKAEGDAGDGMMTEAELMYLSTMEKVKTISKQLVIAEKAFNLVRDRIQQLVARYESMLIKIEDESIATASVITSESSYYSDDYGSEYTSDEEERERELFQKRAQRAELRAELAAREALIAKQEARKIFDEKQREIEILNQRLAELQSESSCQTERAQSLHFEKAITQGNGNLEPSGYHIHSPSRIDNEKINGIKQKFRHRMVERMQSKGLGGSTTSNTEPNIFRAGKSENNLNLRHTHQILRRTAFPQSQRRALVGQEMFQHLDFYERSLKAVNTPLQQYS